MAYYNRYWSNRPYRYNRNEGLERALQHIREAEQLSRELGGTDKDVKKYFFSLPDREKRSIFKAYGAKYGTTKQQYAEQAYHEWKTGKRKMSGLVASRLFNLLPPMMPIGEKHKLVKNLWKEHCPATQKTVNIGAHANESQVISTLTDYLTKNIISYRIPEPLERRFEWLSAGDVNVKQQLLNHLRQLEKQLITEGVSDKIPIYLNHLKDHGSVTSKLNHKIKVGKNKLNLNFVANSDAVTFGNYHQALRDKTTQSTDSDSNIGCWVAIIIFILFCIFSNL